MLELFNSKRKTAKSLIIKTLSEEWPLSARKLYGVIKKEHNAGFTYQAVYFALQELVKEEVLVCKDRKYSINAKWIEGISDFAANLSQKYSKQGSITKPKQLDEMDFTSLSELFKFALANLDSDFFGKSRLLYAQVRRLLPFPIPADQVDMLKAFCHTNEAVILCQGNALQDKLAAKFLRKLGAKVYLGVCCAQPTGTVVINDSVVSYYLLYSKKELSMRNKIAPKVNDGMYGKWLSFINKNLKVKLVINRNSEIKEVVLWATKKLIPE